MVAISSPSPSPVSKRQGGDFSLRSHSAIFTTTGAKGRKKIPEQAQAATLQGTINGAKLHLLSVINCAPYSLWALPIAVLVGVSLIAGSGQ